jgi:hypothetical protein
LQSAALADTHALLGMFNRSSMATVIADSTASFVYHGEPNAE